MQGNPASRLVLAAEMAEKDSGATESAGPLVQESPLTKLLDELAQPGRENEHGLLATLKAILEEALRDETHFLDISV
jgi:hypothetical protein